MIAGRRRLLRVLGLATLGGIAGCSDSSNGGPTPAATSEETETRGDVDTPTATLTPTTSPAPTSRTASSASTAVTTESPPDPKIFATNGDSYDRFGTSVASSADGSVALVGAPGYEDSSGNRGGAAYVFAASDGGWTQRSRITQEDGSKYDEFGSSVSLSNDGATALVGAQGDEDPDAGSAVGSASLFALEGGAWNRERKLTAPDGDDGDYFGSAVELSGDGTTAVVGAHREKGPDGGQAGAVYVATLTGGEWSNPTKVTPPDRENREQFGSSIAVSDDGSTVLVSAPGTGEASGTVDAFRREGSNWNHQTTVTPADETEVEYGSSVALSADGTTAVVGSSFDSPNDDSTNYGSAYVFGFGGGSWQQRTKIRPTDADFQGGNFGCSVDVSSDGTTLIVGASDDDTPMNASGSAYLYSASEDWSRDRKILPEDGDSSDEFGFSVGLGGDGSVAVVGAPRDEDPNGDDAGSAYVYEV